MLARASSRGRDERDRSVLDNAEKRTLEVKICPVFFAVEGGEHELVFVPRKFFQVCLIVRAYSQTLVTPC